MATEKYLLRHLPGTEIDRTRWDDFVKTSTQGSVYANAWFLDVVAPGWSALTVEDKDGQWLAVLPLNIKRKFGLPYSLQPAFSQTLGMLFAPGLDLGEQQQVLQALLPAIPRLYRFNHNFSPGFRAFLPFRWAGYNIQAYQNQVILPAGALALPGDGLEAPLLSTYKYERRRLIRNAQEAGCTVRRGPKPSMLADFLRRFPETARKIGGEARARLLERLVQAAHQADAVQEFTALQPDGTPAVAGIFLGFRNRMSFLFSAGDPALRDQNLNALMLHTAILNALGQGWVFDFEGSMIPGVEQFNRSFGAVPELYFNISRKKPILPGR